MLDLSAYFRRIAFLREPERSLDTLRELHLLHPLAIPFENLSTILGEPVPLDLESLQTKLVRRGRGGYCFEQNALFQAALEALGFELTPLAARVVWGREGTRRVNPRTHMVLLVHLEGEDYLCDVGFGGVTLTAPLKFEVTTEQNTPHERFRLVADDRICELQVFFGEVWKPMYRFDLQAQTAVDYEALNYYVSTHPSSHFLSVLMAGRPHESGRYSLGGNEFTNYEDGHPVEKRQLTSADELKALLVGKFGIKLPDGHALDVALAAIAAGT